MWYGASDISHGPDSFNLSFFEECWDTIKGDVFGLVKEFQLNAKVPKAVTISFLALIPKVNNP